MLHCGVTHITRCITDCIIVSWNPIKAEEGLFMIICLIERRLRLKLHDMNGRNKSKCEPWKCCWLFPLRMDPGVQWSPTVQKRNQQQHQSQPLTWMTSCLKYNPLQKAHKPPPACFAGQKIKDFRGHPGVKFIHAVSVHSLNMLKSVFLACV